MTRKIVSQVSELLKEIKKETLKTYGTASFRVQCALSDPRLTVASKTIQSVTGDIYGIRNISLQTYYDNFITNNVRAEDRRIHQEQPNGKEKGPVRTVYVYKFSLCEAFSNELDSLIILIRCNLHNQMQEINRFNDNYVQQTLFFH